MVFSIALRMLSDRMAAEDVAQEVFMKLYRSTDPLDSTEHVTRWLRRTTVHRSIDAIRHRNARPEAALDFELPASAASGDPIFATKCGVLLAELPDNARAVMTMRYQEDLEPTEIAELLNMPLTTVKSHLKRALALFRERLGGRSLSK